MRPHVFGAALALATFIAVPAFAADPSITLSHPWLRATPRTAPVVGGYVTLTNNGKEPDTLVSASLPMAPEGQVHTMTMKNGVMPMRRLDAGLAIAPGATVPPPPGGPRFRMPARRRRTTDRASPSGCARRRYW